MISEMTSRMHGKFHASRALRGAYPVVLTILLAACSRQGLPPGEYVRPPPTPAPEANVIVRDTIVLVPSDTDLAGAAFQIVATVENTGNAWAKLQPTRSEWTALDGAGAVAASGRMARSYPQYLEPGRTAYLVAYDVRDGIDARQLGDVDISAMYLTVSDPEVTFQLTETNVAYDDQYGLTASGVLIASADRASVDVAVICLDAAGKVLGVAEGRVVRVGQGLIHQRVKAWQEHSFETTGPPTGLQPESCVTAVIEASANDR